nr:hypothetical protein [Serratia marcescens]
MMAADSLHVAVLSSCHRACGFQWLPPCRRACSAGASRASRCIRRSRPAMQASCLERAGLRPSARSPTAGCKRATPPSPADPGSEGQGGRQGKDAALGHVEACLHMGVARHGRLRRRAAW